MFAITISPEAKRDIKAIFEYSIETFGEMQTEKYMDSLDKTLVTVQNMPSRGHTRKDIPNKYLAISSGQHSIIYRFDEKINRVFVIRVLHTRMDFTQKF